MIATVTLQLIQDLEEDSQDQITSGAAAVIGLTVDVEEDDIGVGDDGSLDVPKEHGVFHLALKEIHRLLALAVVRVRAVMEQVRQHFQKVRFTRAKETEIQMPILPVGSGFFPGPRHRDTRR